MEARRKASWKKWHLNWDLNDESQSSEDLEEQMQRPRGCLEVHLFWGRDRKLTLIENSDWGDGVEVGRGQMVGIRVHVRDSVPSSSRSHLRIFSRWMMWHGLYFKKTLFHWLKLLSILRCTFYVTLKERLLAIKLCCVISFKKHPCFKDTGITKDVECVP